MNERFVLITGASRGLGKILSWRFAKEGYGLCLVAQEEKRLNELSIELKQQFKNEIQFISCDLGNSMDIDVLIKKIRPVKNFPGSMSSSIMLPSKGQ